MRKKPARSKRPRSAKALARPRVAEASDLDDAPGSRPASGIVLRADAGQFADDELPRIEQDDGVDFDETRLGNIVAQHLPRKPALPILYDEDAVDEPTNAEPLILTVGFAQSDCGLRRKRNEDSLLVCEDESLYVVADGMGGHVGGAVASRVAVESIDEAFRGKAFEVETDSELPRAASELASAILQANRRVLAQAEKDPTLAGMGTTLSAARFSPNKQRLYVGHVGDSRMYRCRGGRLEQMTCDHTMARLGVTGRNGDLLSRAVGVRRNVTVDVLMAKPIPGDVYVLCSDGLSKMLPMDVIETIVVQDARDPQKAVRRLVDAANAYGGNDNITVIVVYVSSPEPGVRVA